MKLWRDRKGLTKRGSERGPSFGKAELGIKNYEVSDARRRPPSLTLVSLDRIEESDGRGEIPKTVAADSRHYIKKQYERRHPSER
jgi:hypothetical protein